MGLNLSKLNKDGRYEKQGLDLSRLNPSGAYLEPNSHYGEPLNKPTNIKPSTNSNSSISKDDTKKAQELASNTMDLFNKSLRSVSSALNNNNKKQETVSPIIEDLNKKYMTQLAGVDNDSLLPTKDNTFSKENVIKAETDRWKRKAIDWVNTESKYAAIPSSLIPTIIDDINNNNNITATNYDKIAKETIDKYVQPSTLEDVGEMLKPGSIVSGLAYLGEGIAKGGENLLDALLTVGSSKYNPFMQLVGDTDQLQGIADELIKENATQYMMENVLGWDEDIYKELDKVSYFKSDGFGRKLLNVIGEQIPALMAGSGVAAAQGEGVGEIASLISMAPGAFGGGVEAALNNGATRDEAVGYGIMTAGIEVLTEKMFAGVGGFIGKGAIDDAIIKSLQNKVSSRAAKILIGIGGSALGEGAEELIGDFFDAIAQNLTYAREEDIEKLLSDQDYLDDFLLGALSGGIMSGTNAVLTKGESALGDVSKIEKRPNESVQENIKEQEEKPTSGSKTEEEKTEEEKLPTTEETITNEENVPIVNDTVEQQTEQENVDNTKNNQETISETKKTTTDTTKQENKKALNQQTEAVKEQTQVLQEQQKTLDDINSKIPTKTETKLQEADTKIDRTKNRTLSYMDKIEGTVKTNKSGVKFTIPTELYQGRPTATSKKLPSMNRFAEGDYYTPSEKRASNYGEVTTHNKASEFNNPYIQGTPYNDAMVTELKQYAKENPKVADTIVKVLNNGFPLTESVIPAKKLTEMYKKAGYDSFIGGTTTEPEYVSFKTSEKQETKSVEKRKEPSKADLQKIEDAKKQEFVKKMSGLNKKSTTQEVKSTKTPEELQTWKTNLENQMSRFKDDMDKMRSNPTKLKEGINSKLRAYENYLAAGGEKIQSFENLKNDMEATKEANETFNSITDTTEKTNKGISESIAVNNELVDDNVMEMQYELNPYDDLAESMAEDMLVVKSDDSLFNVEWNEQQKEIKGDNLTPEEKAKNELIKKQKELNKKQTKLEKKQSKLSIKQLLLNQFAPIKKLENMTHKSLYPKIKKYMSSTNMAYSTIFHNQVNLNGESIGKSISDIWKNITSLPTNSKRIAMEYIGLQYDLIRKTMDNNYVFENDYADGIFKNKTTDELTEKIEAIKAEHPDLVSIIDTTMKDVRTYYRNLNKMKVESGKLSPTMLAPIDFVKNEMHLDDTEINKLPKKGNMVAVDTVSYLAALNPYYVVIKRDDIPHYSLSGVSATKTSISTKQAKGLKSGSEKHAIQPFWNNMAVEANEIYSSMTLNTAMKNVAEAIPEEWKKEQSAKLNDDGSIQITEHDASKYSLNYTEVNSKGVLTAKSVVVPKTIYNCFETSAKWVTDFQNTILGKGLSKTSAGLKSLYTEYNIAFQYKNKLRDIGSLLLSSKFSLPYVSKYTLSYLTDANSINPENRKLKDTYDNLKGRRYDLGITGDLQTKSKNPIKAINNTYKKITSMLEYSTRYMEFKAAVKKGYSIEEAFAMSEEVTTDFQQSGIFLKQLEQSGIAKFVSAGSAGFNKIIDMAVTNQVNSIKTILNKAKNNGIGEALNKSNYDAYEKRQLKTSLQFIERAGLLAMSTTILKQLMGKDYEEKLAKVPQSIRDQNIIIFYNDNDYIKIPIGRESAAIKLVGNYVTQSKISDTDKYDLFSTLNGVLENVGPASWSDANALSSIQQILENKDYYGNEIYDESDTSADKLKASGKHLLSSYGGWLTSAVKYLNGQSETNPLTGSIVGSTDTVSAYTNRYYTYDEAYKKREGTDNWVKYKYLNYEYMYGDLSKERKRLKELKNNNVSAKEIRAQEEVVKQLWKDAYDTIDNMEVVDLSLAQDGSSLALGNYRIDKQADGSWKKKSKS